jgi:uncharacterized membrane protein YdjX (TVP38/TMEM64 family)
MGISLGVLSGVMMMLCAWAAMKWDYAMPIINMWASVYPGYAATIKGGLFGLAWGFLEGFVFGVLWGWIYNLCLCCCSTGCCCSSTNKGCQS